MDKREEERRKKGLRRVSLVVTEEHYQKMRNVAFKLALDNDTSTVDLGLVFRIILDEHFNKKKKR